LVHRRGAETPRRLKKAVAFQVCRAAYSLGNFESAEEAESAENGFEEEYFRHRDTEERIRRIVDVGGCRVYIRF